MDEISLLTRFRDDIPSTGPSPHIEDRVMAAIRAEQAGRQPGRSRLLVRRRGGFPGLCLARMPVTAAAGKGRRLALAGCLSLALAAGLLTGKVLTAGGSPRQAANTQAVHFALLAAEAAKNRPGYPASQWFYVQERYLAPGMHTARATTYWRTAGPAPEAHGPGVTAQWEGSGRPWAYRQVWAQQAWLQHGKRMAGAYAPIGAGTGTITYRDLTSLPASARAVISYLTAHDKGAPGLELAGPGWGGFILGDPQPGQASRVFTSIASIFLQYLPPPRLAAVLYKALSELPGVTFDRHATDVAGRPGVAFTFPEGRLSDGGYTLQLVINPRDFTFMGVKIFHQGGPLGYATMRQVPVSGPWVRPR